MRGTSTTAALAIAAVLALAGCGSSGSDAGGSSRPARAASATATSKPPNSTSAAPSTSSTSKVAPSSSAAPSSASHSPKPTHTPTPKPKQAPTAQRLPLDLGTGDAEQVITVVSSSGGDTTATLQRWTKAGSRWRKVGGAVDAYVGSDGIGKASESRSKTPAGSFTLTRAFGRDADPGTRLPYLRTTPDDYWISTAGAKYNTEQRCGNCGYDDGTNERLYYVTPEYRHAVVIDYNTANSPGGVKPGAGSAFFLHVANGEPTAGCVAIPSGELTDVMTWLRPSAHPRILIGTG